MTYMPITPFRRAMDAVLISHQKQDGISSEAIHNKWEILRDLGVARKNFGLNDRDIAVLQGLLSFYQKSELSGANIIIFPSNAAISERLNGMALSTLRRHIAKLVAAGVLARRDSPNGKRYLRKRAGLSEAFGFDLSPLLRRHAEITALADAKRAEVIEVQRLREEIALMRRDLLALIAFDVEAAEWSSVIGHVQMLTKVLRRSLGIEDLRQIAASLTPLLDAAKAQIFAANTEETSVNDSQIERHHQNSDKEYFESKDDAEICADRPALEQAALPPIITLPLVLDICTEIQIYSPTPITTWDHLVKTAETLRPMLGIGGDVWAMAKSRFGIENAAITLAAMLERFQDIRVPGAYLRKLCDKALTGLIPTKPMLNALMHRKSSQL